MRIPERLLTLGDSFTIGTGTRPDRSFPAVLANAWRESGRDVTLLNPAVNGYATDDLIAHELPHLAAYRPTLVTLLIGANDVVRGSSDERYRGQLVRIYDAIRKDAPAARVIALPQPDWSLSRAGGAFGDRAVIRGAIERFNQIAREEGKRAGAAWVELFPLMRAQARRGMFADDGLHPSADAYAEWGRELAVRL
jgi:lysophospholipase L1-like esterase